MNHYYHSIFGWFDFERVYHHVVSILPENSKVAEINSWTGKSSSYLLVEAKNSDKKFDFHFCSDFENIHKYKNVDSGNCGDVYNDFTNNLDRADYPYKVYNNNSIEFSKNFKDESFDFVFISANEDDEVLRNELKAWYPKVKKGGVIAGTDYISEKGGYSLIVDEFFYEDLILSVEHFSTSWLVIKQYDYPANCIINQPKHTVKYAQFGLTDESILALFQ